MPEDSASPQRPGPTGARVIHLTDFAQVSSVFSSWQGRFEQLSRGRFEGTLRVIRGGVVRIVAIEANQRVLLRGRDTAGLFSVYPVIAGNAGSLWQGRQLAPGQLVVHGTDGETDHFSARRTDNRGVSLQPKALEEAARVLLKTDIPALSHTWAALTPPPEAFVGLNRQLARLLKLGIADPSLLGTPEGRRLEQACVGSLVTTLFSTSDPKHWECLTARSQLLRRAEEFMRARLADPIGAIDLCKELGASDRTLRLAFRERFGLGPMAFFKKLRLNAVRSLLIANPEIAITDAAREFGFHHLGNFAADYRRLFGELPSATPRRAAAMLPASEPGHGGPG